MADWFPEWLPWVEEKEAYPFLGEWGSPKIDKGEWVDIDTQLPLQPKTLYRFIYDIEGSPVFWKDPKDLASDISAGLKKEYGLLGDDFLVHYWRCDPEARTFEVQIERVPPFITTPPEVAEVAIPAAVPIIAVVAGIVITALTAYFTVRLILRNTEKWKEVIIDPFEKWLEFLREFKPVFYIIGVGFLGAVGAYIFKQVAKPRKT
jgi:hypothetical protein